MNFQKVAVQYAGFLLLAGMIVWPGLVAVAEEKPPARQRLANYVGRVRDSAIPAAGSVGSLWSPQGAWTDLAVDYKARNVNDLIVIHIVEQTRAQSSGSVQAQREFGAGSGISGLFGPVGARSGLQALFSPSSQRSLDGSAETASSSHLSTTLAGHVVEVLPNGSLVVEAAREVEMNNERQSILLRGIVRPGDVTPDNSVLSTAISHLEVELEGEGVISDGVRPPNRIVRAILRVLGF